MEDEISRIATVKLAEIVRGISNDSVWYFLPDAARETPAQDAALAFNVCLGFVPLSSDRTSLFFKSNSGTTRYSSQTYHNDHSDRSRPSHSRWSDHRGRGHNAAST